MPSFWFTTKFNRAWVEGLMWLQNENMMILYFAYLLVLVEKAGKVDQKKKKQVRCVLRACSNTANLQEVLRLVPYHFMERWSSWREETYRCRSCNSCIWSEKRQQSVSTADSICPLLIFKPHFWRHTAGLILGYLVTHFKIKSAPVSSRTRSLLWVLTPNSLQQ